MASAEFLKFEAEWDRKIRVMFEGPPPPRGHIPFIQKCPLLTDKEYTGSLDGLSLMRRMISKAQQILTRDMVLDRALRGQTSSKWFAMPTRQQRDIIERSLEAALADNQRPASRDETRFLMSEVRVDRLLANGGQGFIDLAESFCAPTAEGGEINWASHKGMDQVFGTISYVLLGLPSRCTYHSASQRCPKSTRATAVRSDPGKASLVNGNLFEHHLERVKRRGRSRHPPQRPPLLELLLDVLQIRRRPREPA